MSRFARLFGTASKAQTASWFRERVVEYARRNPWPTLFASAGFAGSVFGAEQLFEYTDVFQKWWIRAQLNKPMQFAAADLPAMYVTNEWLARLVKNCLEREVAEERIDMIAGAKGIGKTTEVKHQLNQKRHVIYVDLHSIEDNNLKAVREMLLKAVSFRKAPKGGFICFLFLCCNLSALCIPPPHFFCCGTADLNQALQVLAEVSREYQAKGESPVTLVIDGSNKVC